MHIKGKQYIKLFLCLLGLSLVPIHTAALTNITLSPPLEPVPGPVPENCGQEGFSFVNGQLILNPQGADLSSQPMYLIQNRSDFPQISLTRKTINSLAAAWTTRIDAGQWSALALTHPQFVVNCFGRKPGAIGYVDCASVLLVCSYPHAQSSNGAGSHWIAENSSLLDVLTSVKQHGINLPPQ
jgi:hypothetical protein